MKSGGRLIEKLGESVLDDSGADEEPVAGGCVGLIDPDGVLCAEVPGASVDVDAASVEPVVVGAVAELASMVVELELSVDCVLAVADSLVDMDVVVVTPDTKEVVTPDADEVVIPETDEAFCVDIDVVFCVDIDVVFRVDIDVVCVVDVCGILLLSTATWQFVRAEAADKVFFSQHWPS